MAEKRDNRRVPQLVARLGILPLFISGQVSWSHTPSSPFHVHEGAMASGHCALPNCPSSQSHRFNFLPIKVSVAYV